MFGYLFFSVFGSQPNISTPSTLVFPLLQKFEFTLHVRYCCVIRAWSVDLNPSSYLQLWIGCVHQSYTAGASLGEELTGPSSLGAGDFTLFGLITFKICHMPSYGWAMVTKNVHQLKLLQLSRSDDRSLTMAQLLRFIKIIWTRANYVTNNWQEVANGLFSTRCTCCPIS